MDRGREKDFEDQEWRGTIKMMYLKPSQREVAVGMSLCLPRERAGEEEVKSSLTSF